MNGFDERVYCHFCAFFSSLKFIKMLRKMDESMGVWRMNDHFVGGHFWPVNIFVSYQRKPYILTFTFLFERLNSQKNSPNPQKMRISLLIFLCFAIFPSANLLEDENAKMLMEGLRKSLDGLETDQSKIRWDEQGFRVEEKNWQEKAGDWLNNIFGGKRRKRENENQMNGNGEEDDPEELIRVNAKIVFYKNGTRVVDLQDGPLITVDPKGQISLDYHNGTMQKLSGSEMAEGISRNKRFATLDDLYMAHGFEFDRKDAADFGQDLWENGPNGGKLERAGDSSEDDEDNDGEWQWARATEQKNPYWDKPLYGMGNVQQQSDGNRQTGIGMNGNQNKGEQQSSPTFQQQFQQPAPPPKSTIFETFETPSNRIMAGGNTVQNSKKFGGGMPSANNIGGLANSQTNKQQWGGGQSIQQPTNFGQQPSNLPIQPPSPSPSSWLQSQLNSQKPLSPEELELAKKLMRRMEQKEKGKTQGENGQTTMIGQHNGNAQERGDTKQQQGNVQQQPQNNRLPKWAQPKAN